MAKDCTNLALTRCYNCGKDGHMASECTEASTATCYHCGEQGHVKKDCPTRKKEREERDETQAKRRCFNCGDATHEAADCPVGRKCFICKEEGHSSKDCPHRDEGKCFNCGQTGHATRDCPKTGLKICISFQHGSCSRGAECRYLHGFDGEEEEKTAAGEKRRLEYEARQEKREAKIDANKRQKVERVKSQYSGVLHAPERNTKPWRAVCKVKGKRKYLGFYETELQAHEARLNYFKELDAAR